MRKQADFKTALCFHYSMWSFTTDSRHKKKIMQPTGKSSELSKYTGEEEARREKMFFLEGKDNWNRNSEL